MHDTFADNRMLAEFECRMVINRFAACLDTFDDGGVLALVTDDCLWRGTPEAEGHVGIRARLAGRSRQMRTLHVVTGTVVEFDSEDRAKARTIVTVYRFDKPGVHPPGLPHTLGVYDDRFRRVGERWLIAERRLTPLAQA
jgi:SnoaL-like domain